MFQFDMAGIDNFIERIQLASDDAPLMTAMAVETIANDITTRLQAASPYDGAANNGVLPGEEGHLNESFTHTTATEGIVSTAEVTTTEPIKFGYVTSGTSGPILPVQKKGLWWPALAHPVKQVAGQAANPFQLQVMQAAQADMDITLETTINMWLKDL